MFIFLYNIFFYAFLLIFSWHKKEGKKYFLKKNFGSMSLSFNHEFCETYASLVKKDHLFYGLDLFSSLKL